MTDTLNPNTTSKIGFHRRNNTRIISLISQGRRGIIAGIVEKEVSAPLILFDSIISAAIGLFAEF